ncbi:hydroxyacid dehydrogenase [Ruficoccus sp. ZRK36]|uniref:hydroxyacid dehydrogenase n=1 Tax=Ruficoccus sp. ZRK36 TaxID=2866311 RepID=UPI001C72E5C6|nr:hydroxyacid dehydrogenase [Ruficoccus sp. ZRK36]QYY36047.1 hydroxyacid dehydrogenase [Ruficoccus sp. ZRK36]
MPKISPEHESAIALETPADKSRVLVAISPRDYDRFFPGGMTLDAGSCDLRIAAPQQLEPGNWVQLLREYQPEILMTAWSTPPLTRAITAEEWLSIRYVCHLSGSVKKLLDIDLIERGISVTNWGSMITPCVAEHALLLILACCRKATLWQNFRQFSGPSPERARYLDDLQTMSLQGRRVGIHGFGKIARHLIQLLKPFGVRISAYSTPFPAETMQALGVQPQPDIDTLFANSDVLVECEALTPETAKSVTRERLERLPDDAVFVNIARGGLVDEEALIDVARSQRIRIGLDVYAREPLAPASPLWDIPGAILSPHIAGPTHDVYAQCGNFALENIQHYLRGEPLQSVIDANTYQLST